MNGRKIWQWTVLIGVLITLQPGSSQGQSAADLTRKLEQLRAYPDLVVINAKISTMDAQLNEFQAMAVKNNRILVLGTNDEVRFLAGPKTEILDAKGQRVLPGLIDAHTHPHLWAVSHWLELEGEFTVKKYNDPQLRIVHATGNDQTEILRNLERVVRQRIQELGPGKWIWVHLFGGSSLPESRKLTYPLIAQPPISGAPLRPAPITREFLDAIAPENPLIVNATEMIGPGIHNSRAKEEMLKVLGREVDGLGAWTPVLYDILMRGRTEEKVDFLKRELMTCLAAQGITTFANHYYGTPSIMQIYRLLNERGEMPVRYAWWVGGGRGFAARDYEDDLGYPVQGVDRDPLGLAAPDLGDFRGIGNDYIWNAGIAFEVFDSGIGCTTAKKLDLEKSLGPWAKWLRDCQPIDYEKDPMAGGHRYAQAALESGLRVGYLHTLSDGSIDALFHMIEQAIAKGKLTLDQVKALRISTEHNPFIRPDQVEKIAKYGIRAKFSYWQATGLFGPEFLKLHGEQYLSWLLPMKSLLDAGARPVFTTDAHVHNDPPEFTAVDSQWENIWGFMEYYLTRTTPFDKRVPATPREAVDRVNLLRSATIWAAEEVLNEKNIGSLEVGKLADFIVLDKDYFTVPEDQVHTINTVLTVVGGKIEFKSPSY